MGVSPCDSDLLSSCDAYFEKVKSRKKLPQPLQETLTTAFARIPVSSFPQVPTGKVIEIQADTTIADAVKILSDCNILSAPVVNPKAASSLNWRERYLGIIGYSEIILWVLESAELDAVTLSTSTATAVGLGAGAVGALGALAVGASGPAAMGAAVAGGVKADQASGGDAPAAADNLGKEFYKAIVQEEPFKSTAASQKFKNYITQSAVIEDPEGCRGRDWFDCIIARPISDMGLPFMSPDEDISVQSDDLILEAFKRMRDNQVGGLAVVEEPGKKIVGNVSIRDNRHLMLKPELFTNFRQLTVKDFISTVVSTGQDFGRPTSPVTCKVDSTLGGVIQNLATKKVHRVYVVADENEVIGVITLRDVISCFIYEPPNFFDNYFGFSVREMLNK
ncbi:SNF1-related protein kinase regulatory subunit gamma-1-like [Hibiscus syriacus]|uniref:SNF1-related protein kinase regulatory subunit gamma-1-like n=1 Tax=Hibiscus syriacus TaxID=106335 RepID=A0A6A2YUA6_HIBSY|nr:SNF1-related protein kinase regulatory subunit gamma-1-like [Hibiscus syriacus]